MTENGRVEVVRSAAHSGKSYEPLPNNIGTGGDKAIVDSHHATRTKASTKAARHSQA